MDGRGGPAELTPRSSGAKSGVVSHPSASIKIMDGDYSNDVDLSEPGTLARVRHVSDDGRVVFLDYRNGFTATATSDAHFELVGGDVVLVRNGFIDRVPNEVWPEEMLVGVVRLKHEDVTLLDGGGRWHSIPTRTDVDYRVGNTVEARESVGVFRVLQEEPVRLIDLPDVDETIVSRFRVDATARAVSFDDFGGLRDVVARAKELVEVPLLHHDKLTKIKARPVKGVLFTGPPGAGKTMLARIIASQSGAAFYEISGPEIFSKWYGQSEQLLRLIFEDARSQPRSIIFFDEIESVAAHRAEDGHEASRRVVAQLLTLMDGFEPDENVVVVAATNRPGDIDLALRRPGRFDWQIDFPLPNREDRTEILRVAERRHTVGPRIPHGFIAAKTEGWTGAELAAIWTEAALLAVTDDRAVILAEDMVGGYERVAALREIRIRTAPKGQT